MKTTSKFILLASVAFFAMTGITACGSTDNKNNNTPTQNSTPGKSSVIESHSQLTYNWEKLPFTDNSGVQIYIDLATIEPNASHENWYDAFMLGQDSEKQSTVFSVTADCEAQNLRINNAVFYDQPKGQGKPFSIKVSNGDFVTPKDENENALIQSICSNTPANLQN